MTHTPEGVSPPLLEGTATVGAWARKVDSPSMRTGWTPGGGTGWGVCAAAEAARAPRSARPAPGSFPPISTGTGSRALSGLHPRVRPTPARPGTRAANPRRLLSQESQACCRGHLPLGSPPSLLLLSGCPAVHLTLACATPPSVWNDCPSFSWGTGLPSCVLPCVLVSSDPSPPSPREWKGGHPSAAWGGSAVLFFLSHGLRPRDLPGTAPPWEPQAA